MLEIIIIGGGGFGREVHDWLIDINKSCGESEPAFRIKGFLDHNHKCLDGFQVTARVIGNPDDYQICKNDRFVVAVGVIDVRKKLVGTLKQKGAKFFTLIHPTAIISGSARLGEGVVICPFSMVNADVRLGDFILLNIFASVAHDVHVGSHSVLCPYATINGFAKLDEEVFMATHATVTSSILVGKRATVSANSVAMRNVPPNHLVYGVPGKLLHLGKNIRK